MTAAEIPPAPFSQKILRGGENGSHFSRKHTVASKTPCVLAENTPWQAKCGTFSVKIHRDEQNAACFDRKHAEVSKTPRVLTENTPGRAKRPAFWQKTRQGEQNGSRFDKKHAVAGKTPVPASNILTRGRTMKRVKVDIRITDADTVSDALVRLYKDAAGKGKPPLRK